MIYKGLTGFLSFIVDLTYSNVTNQVSQYVHRNERKQSLTRQ